MTTTRSTSGRAKLKPKKVRSQYVPEQGNIPVSTFRSPLGERTHGNVLLHHHEGTSGTYSAEILSASRERSKSAIAHSSERSANTKKNVRGGTGDPHRGKWVTPKSLALAVGRFDLDAFTNPYSHVVATDLCMLEDGGDGFGDGKTPGSYRAGTGPLKTATSETRFWGQPPYERDFVRRAYEHYKHTRWTWLLRFDPRTDWWREIYDASELVAVVVVDFEPPPGVPDPPGSTFPHALYFRRAEDMTPEVRRMAAAVWKKRSALG